MRKTTWAVVISSVFLGAVAARAEPAAAPEADTAKGTSNAEVGSERSNVDKQSSSPAYHPYSAGTVGDDPAKPTSTSAPKDAREPGGGEDPGATDQWGDVDLDGDGHLSHVELTKLEPALSASFSAMDANGDQKLTRAEFRTWHESLKTRMGTE